jgi:hypothetical protein
MNDTHVRKSSFVMVQGQFRTGMELEDLGQCPHRHEIEVGRFLERRGPINVELGERFQAGGAKFVQLRFDYPKGLQHVGGGGLR